MSENADVQAPHGEGFWTRLFRRNLPNEQRALLGTLAFFAMIVLAGWVGVNEPSRMAMYDRQFKARSIQRGAGLFFDNCRPCHGPNGEGIVSVAPAINDPNLFNGNRLQELAYPGSVEDFVRSTVAAGRPARSADWPNPMPTWSQEYGGPLRPDQVEDLVAFIMNWGCAYDPECAPEGELVSGPPPEATVEATPVPFTPVGPDLAVALPEGDAARGQALFSGAQPGPDGAPLGCNACHSLDGSVVVGPSIQGLSGRIPSGYDSAEAYLHEAIVQPNAHVVEGFAENIMPQNFGERLDAQSLADLIAYLATQ